ncbi:MAG: hypothetical protein JWN03_1999 [Nocardia sp.]|uniref:hypothetical protein n=1 Tax=Nocardia sp. TaxID=1821 RepID=UPI0026049D04|nr:hypothetical protein [Nocardia sp.]MCU1641724.1 hypothetical protein [Nocardia sp.]
MLFASDVRHMNDTQELWFGARIVAEEFPTAPAQLDASPAPQQVFVRTVATLDATGFLRGADLQGLRDTPKQMRHGTLATSVIYDTVSALFEFRIGAPLR